MYFGVFTSELRLFLTYRCKMERPNPNQLVTRKRRVMRKKMRKRRKRCVHILQRVKFLMLVSWPPIQLAYDASAHSTECWFFAG